MSNNNEVLVLRTQAKENARRNLRATKKKESLALFAAEKTSPSRKPEEMGKGKAH